MCNKMSVYFTAVGQIAFLALATRDSKLPDTGSEYIPAKYLSLR